MQLHNLQPKTETRSKKRVGRGGKRGTTSGKGQKGQKSRAGHKIRPAQRDLIIRTPKMKGYKHKPTSVKSLALSLNQISKLSEKVITKEALLAHHVIRSISQPIKIVSTGSIDGAREIVGIPISVSARTKIKKAGGSVK